MSALKSRVIDTCKRTGEFTTRSGQVVNTYFDKYQFEGRPELLRDIVKALAEKIDIDFDVLAGLEMGGIPVATALSLEMNRPCVFVRKKAKTYGTERIFEGPEISGKRVLIVEDVTTTGGQILISSKELAAAGAHIVGVVLVIARAQEAVDALENAQLPLIALITPADLEALSK
ncbi:orotate phosphoribosyltransferase [uncultured Maritalea sp.]|uniref:orotate phosphoribosyltransferase n=1 Tax=uncultured Maritalea sp. TaxID=757249 RepID=UPI002601F97F|nr:orotate phosphoribosyltransferase [uncultured Maritalea sp.]